MFHYVYILRFILTYSADIYAHYCLRLIKKRNYRSLLCDSSIIKSLYLHSLQASQTVDNFRQVPVSGGTLTHTHCPFRLRFRLSSAMWPQSTANKNEINYGETFWALSPAGYVVINTKCSGPATGLHPPPAALQHTHSGQAEYMPKVEYLPQTQFRQKKVH